MSSKMLIRPFQLFNRFPNCFLFYMVNTLIFASTPPLHFLKSQSLKLKVFCTCVGTYVMHGTRSSDPKKLFRVSIYCTGPSVGLRMTSNCWLQKKAVACEFAPTRFALTNIAKPILQGSQACTI